MATNAPTIMVSSTYYDLRQIRKDLASFIENDLGYNSLLSEFDSFPIDPDNDTIENCRRRVERDADILVLIIGGRYGYVDPKSSKSVTNLEYLSARAKGIPIYAFIDKGILPLLEVWEKNPKTKFNGIVSDVKVFEFIRQVRSVDKVWTHNFEYAHTICDTLRKQFAYLMREGLQFRHQIASIKEDIPKDISGKTLRLILEKPRFWEYYLIAQVLIDESAKCYDLRQEHKLSLVFGSGEVVTKDAGIDWFMARINELSRLVHSVEELVNNNLFVALGPPGTPADVNGVVYISKKVIEVYRQALEWSQRIRHVYISEHLMPIIHEMASFPNDLINKIENIGPEMIRELDVARSIPKGQPINITISVNINLAVKPEFNELLRDCFLNSPGE